MGEINKVKSTREQAVEKIVLNFRIFGVYLSNDEIRGLLMVSKDKFPSLVTTIASQHNITLV